MYGPPYFLAKPIAFTAVAAIAGDIFIFDNPIFNGLALSLIFGFLISTGSPWS